MAPTRKRSQKKSRSRSRKQSQKKSRSQSRKRSQKKSRSQSRKRSQKKSRSRSRKRSQKKSRSQSRKRSRKRSQKKSSSRKKRKAISKLEKPKPKGVSNLCVPAADRMMTSGKKMYRPHLFLTEILSDDFVEINAIKKDAKIYMMYVLKPDSTGKYLGKYSRTRLARGGSGKIMIEGGVEIFNKKLHTHLKKKYGDQIGDYRAAHVKLGKKGGKTAASKVKLYKEFNLGEMSLKCD